MRNPRLHSHLPLLVMLVLTLPAQASLTTDLQSMVTELNVLNTGLSGISIDGNDSCSELGTLNASIEGYISSAETLTSQLSAPLTLTTEDMGSLDDLSNLARSMASETARLSWEMRSIEDVQELIEYRTAVSAMLRLSDDIGTMADRILEMADRILIMADNIGTMADRILTTQNLLSSNIALTQSTLLITINNMVLLSDSLSSIGYNLSLGLLNDEIRALADDMAEVVLTETDMASELEVLEFTTSAVLNKAVDIYTTALLTSQDASHYINGDTLTLLGDTSRFHQALADSLEKYAETIELLAPTTNSVVLADATASMLRLTRDIGLVSDRILEMTDKIIVMADNIGIMADRIIETQNIQQTNVLLTQSSLLAAQGTVITTIKNMGL
ncbi:hypothetical protein [Thiohalomonas denitrificans]|uniref:hypothetical protein n=1 Tax=Thiohalomonas denitrificans TaxID=415747 RepID=UPI0026E967AE|nr:hypothetical protein [Thiohalomonas denitrificans]